MHKKIYAPLLLLLSVFLINCKSEDTDLTYNTEELKLVQVSKNSYVHISYLELKDGRRFPCNGLVYVNDNEAIVFDSPTEPKIAETLISWLSDTHNLKITAFVANHFHNDCIGGIETFHKSGITSYGHIKTQERIEQKKKALKRTFRDSLTLKVGKGIIVNRYFGEAHTPDNIVSYIPDEKLLFGGCMIKSLEAAKGNLEDANLAEWANTVSRIKAAYPDLKTVIPGHGSFGNTSLLDYTIQLFSEDP